MPIAKSQARTGLFYGWYIVAFAFMAQLVGGPYVFGVFFRPMTQELGWTRGEFSLANTFSVVVGGIMGFFIGPLIDRRSSRWLIVSGSLVAGLSVLGLAFVNELWQFWVIRGVIYVIGGAGMSPLVVNAILSKWFVRQRGRAISLASMGFSAGAVVLVPIVAFVIEAFGWRTAWVVQGLLIWVVMILPAALVVRRQPEDIGLLPDGETAESLALARAAPPRPHLRSAGSEVQWTRQEAVRTKELWLLIAIFGIGGLPASAIVLHLIPFLQDSGFSVGLAVFLAGFENLLALVSKPAWGYYFDKMDPRHLVALGWGMKVIPLFVMPLVASTWGLPAMLPLLALYGTGVGSGQTGQEVIWAHYFGRQHIGAVRSVAMPFSIVFGAGGTWFAGAAWDMTGSYTFAFMLFAALSLIAMVMVVVCGPPTRKRPSSTGVAQPTAPEATTPA